MRLKSLAPVQSTGPKDTLRAQRDVSILPTSLLPDRQTTTFESIPKGLLSGFGEEKGLEEFLAEMGRRKELYDKGSTNDRAGGGDDARPAVEKETRDDEDDVEEELTPFQRELRAKKLKKAKEVTEVVTEWPPTNLAPDELWFLNLGQKRLAKSIPRLISISCENRRGSLAIQVCGSTHHSASQPSAMSPPSLPPSLPPSHPSPP